MRSKKRRINQSKKRKRSRRKKGKGIFGDIGRGAMGSNIKGRIVGCKHFDKDTKKYANGNYNNLAFPAFLSAMLCRAAYEYDALFMHLLVFIFNLKQTQSLLKTQLKSVKSYHELISSTLKEPTFKSRSMTDKFNPLALGKAIEKMKKRLAKSDTFNKDGGQYYGTIYNTALEIVGSRRKEVWKDRAEDGKKDRVTHWNPQTHENIFDQIYNAVPDAFDRGESNIGSSKNLNFVMIQNSHDLNLYVVYDKKSNTIVVVFRGTASMASAKDDLKPLLHPTTTGNKSDSDGMIHRGFGQQLKGSINRIINSMKYVFEKGNGVPATPPEIFVCGHSLGGANSSLFCYYYQKWITGIAEKIVAPYLDRRMSLITWGAPRIGDMKFIRNYDELLKNGKIVLLRCTTDGDAVPTVPLEKMNYYHPGKTLKGGEGHSEYPHRYVCAHRLNKTLQLSYSKPLYCGERKWCDIVPSMVAHSNAAYVSFGGIGRTATFGSGLPGYTTYLRKNDYTGEKGVQLVKLKEYTKSDYISEELYKKEMNQSNRLPNEVTSEPKESFTDGVRLSGNEIGTGIFGTGLMTRGKKLSKSEKEVVAIEEKAGEAAKANRKEIEKKQGLAHGNLEKRLKKRAAAAAAGGGRKRTRRKKRTKKKARKKRRKSKRRR
jgi:hypothetical protein